MPFLASPSFFVSLTLPTQETSRDFHKFWYQEMLLKFTCTFQLCFKYSKITITLHEDLYIFLHAKMIVWENDCVIVFPAVANLQLGNTRVGNSVISATTWENASQRRHHPARQVQDTPPLLCPLTAENFTKLIDQILANEPEFLRCACVS